KLHQRCGSGCREAGPEPAARPHGGRPDALNPFVREAGGDGRGQPHPGSFLSPPGPGPYSSVTVLRQPRFLLALPSTMVRALRSSRASFIDDGSASMTTRINGRRALLLGSLAITLTGCKFGGGDHHDTFRVPTSIAIADLNGD